MVFFLKNFNKMLLIALDFQIFNFKIIPHTNNTHFVEEKKMLGIGQTDHHKSHIISAVGRKANFEEMLPNRMKKKIHIEGRWLRIYWLHVCMCICAAATINTCCGTFQCLRLFWIIHKHMIWFCLDFSTQCVPNSYKWAEISRQIPHSLLEIIGCLILLTQFR